MFGDLRFGIFGIFGDLEFWRFRKRLELGMLREEPGLSSHLGWAGLTCPLSPVPVSPVPCPCPLSPSLPSPSHPCRVPAGIPGFFPGWIYPDPDPDPGAQEFLEKDGIVLGSFGSGIPGKGEFQGCPGILQPWDSQEILV